MAAGLIQSVKSPQKKHMRHSADVNSTEEQCDVMQYLQQTEQTRGVTQTTYICYSRQLLSM